MKLNSQAFPYPVLTSEEGSAADYRDSAFQCTLDIIGSIGEDQKFTLEYSFLLSNDEIAVLIENDEASYALEISCSETLKREMKFLQQYGELEVDASELYGKVDFTPVVVVRKQGLEFTSVDLNEEFAGAKFTLNIGDIIAIDETWSKYIDFNSLAFDTLVRVQTDEALEPLQYRVEPSPSFVTIWMGQVLRDLWNDIKQDNKKKPWLMMSIYKDVIYMALEDLVVNSDADSQQWARSLRGKLADLDIELPKESDFNSINMIAQRLVNSGGVERLAKEHKIKGVAE